DDMDAEPPGRLLDRFGDRAGYPAHQVPQGGGVEARGEAGGGRLGQHEQLGTGGGDAAVEMVHAGVEVGLDRLRGERSGRGRHLEGGGDEGNHHTHRPRRPMTAPTTTPSNAAAAPIATPVAKSPPPRGARGGAANTAPFSTTGAAPVRTSSTAAKNSPAVFFATPARIRCPTPPTGPPTTASASYVSSVPPFHATSSIRTSAETVPGA